MGEPSEGDLQRHGRSSAQRPQEEPIGAVYINNMLMYSQTIDVAKVWMIAGDVS